jgi:DNA-binding transcriptional MocR family regulator
MTVEKANLNAEQVFLTHFQADYLHLSSSHELLPSVRDLSKRYRISPVTVTRGLKHLVQSGKIITKPGAGTFVAPTTCSTPLDASWQALALGARIPLGEETQILTSTQRPDVISLGSGYPDERLQPHALLNKAAQHALRRPEVWSRSPAAGIEPLRLWFARELSPDFSSNDVLIAPGGQAAVATCLRALVPPSGTVIFESPSYFGALAVARSSGLETIPVPIDADGIRPDYLEAAFAKSGASVAYLQPSHQNPTSAILSPERRKAVLSIAAKYNAFLIEDDYAHDFTLEGTKPKPLILDDTDGRIVYIRSLTKSAAPSLRIAAIIARGAVSERLKAQLAISEMFTPQILQLTALELIGSPSYLKHLKDLRLTLKKRRDTLVTALEQHGYTVPTIPKGGFGIWLPLPYDDLEFTQNALRKNVQVAVGKAWFPAEKSGEYARLSFAASDETALLEAVKRLSEIR